MFHHLHDYSLNDFHIQCSNLLNFELVNSKLFDYIQSILFGGESILLINADL